MQIKVHRIPTKEKPYTIGFFTDIHLNSISPKSRLDEYGASVLDKLLQVQELAKSWDLTLFGGDLFHSHRQNYPYLCRVLEILEKWPSQLYGIYGNHDYRGNVPRQESATAIVYASGLVRELSDLSILFNQSRKWEEILYIQGMNYKKKAGFPECTRSTFNILISHQLLDGFGDDKDDVIQGSPNKWDLVLMGHSHKGFTKQIGKTQIVCPGSLGRVSRTETHNPCVLEVSYTGSGMTIAKKNIRASSPETIFSEERAERERLESKIQEYVRSLEVNAVDDNAGVSDRIRKSLEDICPNEKVRSNCLFWLKEYAVL